MLICPFQLSSSSSSASWQDVCTAVEQEAEKKCVKLLTVLSIYFSSVSCANLNFSVAFECLRSATCRVRVNERLKRVYQHYHHPLSETVTRPAPYSVFVCLSTTLLYYIRKKTENLPQELTYKLYISVRKVRWGRELYWFTRAELLCWLI